ncbi:transposase, partial [Liquorilactobacillus satsumensis]|uniref:transposase n=1 Tax=Liquorilactobacillus satsumensis TaxID=259059 RepID=UPI0039E98650
QQSSQCITKTILLILHQNRPVEGTNNKIKVIKRTAYGFRNFENFRLRILVSLKNSYLNLNYHYHIKKAIHSEERIA